MVNSPPEIIAISPSSRYITFLVYSMIGAASLATKYSSSPIPTTSGLPNLAAINLSGSSLLTNTIPYAPTTFCNAALTASSNDNPL